MGQDQVLAFVPGGRNGVRVGVDLSRIVDDLGRVGPGATLPRNITFRARMLLPGLWSLNGDPTQVHRS